ncbi:MAG: YutD family protein [Bacilli bacterium]|jgi:uncharacterized protein YutD|nr:YutD family protein [Bacilli bacterium]
MKEIEINKKKYHILKDVKNAFDYDVVKEKVTDYFEEYDYIVGDWAYGKLRLKGFNSKTNKNFKPINDIDKVDDYLKQNCAFNCSYFILAKIID